MRIELFEHNQSAYQAALTMLAETGKAAVIHPTGTGKSFIGFALCAEHPDKRICWLSPSEYIFRTQLENLAASTDGELPENIAFFTYAKLMRLEPEELAALCPDYIVLDEFHRCGAEMWGAGVQRLLAAYPQIPVLGLSATNIRYLDNQRDMADELFDGNIASEMTLGEAIVRGILQPPKYVLSLFSCRPELEKYERRVRRSRNPATREAGEEYLEAIRRALEQADGLDLIFERHMTEPRGKYLVFCADKEHMDEMMSHVPEWFGRVDREAHVYAVYTEDPGASESFQQFKKDESDHLRLLFAIDMLNEGIHVDDVSGVILLRPTVSPIVYKQQIGRALSASSGKEPVIFDIVNNIENLYSIGLIEEEVRAAITYYHYLGEDKHIVHERFQILDEVRDCRELFEKLNDTLSASWDIMYDHAKAYYEKHGDLEIPRRHKTPEGYSLGDWVSVQRRVRAGLRFGKLSEERIAKLDAIGMRWDSERDLSWQRYFGAAERYVQAFGDLNVRADYVNEEGLALGRWIANIRSYGRSGIKTKYLTPERRKALDALGMIWHQPDYLWERNFAAAMEYYRANGHLSVPHDYVTEDGLRLGAWITNLRNRRDSLSSAQIQRLDEIHMLWENRYSKAWETGYAEAEKYVQACGHLNVPTSHVSESGYKLGAWISDQREKNAAGKLKAARKARLDALGMRWRKEDPWERRYAMAKAYYEEHGNLSVPGQFVVQGVWLNKWLNEQRQIYAGNRAGKKLTAEQIRRLEAIGMRWGQARAGRYVRNSEVSPRKDSLLRL